MIRINRFDCASLVRRPNRYSEEKFVAARDTNHDAGFHRTGPVIESVAVLAITYIAMFFAVAGITHAPISPEAAATALIAPLDDTASSSPSSVSQSLHCGSFDQVSEPTDKSDEHRSNVAIDSNCMCD